MVQKIYKINAWCFAKDEATMDTIFNSLLSDLQIQKGNGNITEGNVTKNIIEKLDDPSGYSENI